MREAMPLTAALVDELRQTFGSGRIVALIARSQHLRREHARIVAVLGQAEADRWLAREQAAGGWFGAVEAGRQVGVLGVACTRVVPPLGPSRSAGGRGNSDPGIGLFNGSSKGVM